MDCQSLSVQEIQQEQIHFSFNLYPNPTTNHFTIHLENSTALEIVKVYNMLGQLVLTSKEPIVNTSSLSDGLYIVEVKTNKGKGFKKLVIQ